MKEPTYNLQPVAINVVQDMCSRYHGYGGAGRVVAYAFAVYENERPVAAYAWQPPPPGASRAVAPAEPSCVLALSRMVAVPRDERALRHVSRPLRRQMRMLIDRTRWPVLVTYSDEGQGHTGHVYRCSGWTPTVRRRVPFYVDALGVRVSRYQNGITIRKQAAGYTWIQRWEHRVCPVGQEAVWLADHGWRREPLHRVWRSGVHAMRWVRAQEPVA